MHCRHGGILLCKQKTRLPSNSRVKRAVRTDGQPRRGFSKIFYEKSTPARYS